MVEYLLQFDEIKATLNFSCAMGNTVLHYACQGSKCSKNLKTINKKVMSDCPRSLELLLEHGADVSSSPFSISD